MNNALRDFYRFEVKFFGLYGHTFRKMFSVFGILSSFAFSFGFGQGLKNIDVVILYSQNASNTADDYGQNILTLINNAVANANEAYLHSNAGQRIRMVRLEMTINFTDLATPTANRIALQDPHDGILDYVHSIREQYFADIVVLVVDFEVTNTSGVGNAQVCGYPTSSCNGSFESASFAAIHWGYLNQRTLAHELGHLMGLHHERAELANPPPVGAGPDAYGYRRWDLGENSFSTIMGKAIVNSSGTLRRVPYFSNPNVNEPTAGVPMGIDQTVNPVASANSARVLREVTGNVANKWRENLNGLSFSYNNIKKHSLDDNLSDQHLKGGSYIAGEHSGLIISFSDTAKMSLDPSGNMRAAGFSENQSNYPPNSLRFINSLTGEVLGGIGTDGVVRSKGIVSPAVLP